MTIGLRRSMIAGLCATTFATGFLCGTTLGSRPAEAQMGEMGGEMMKKAGEQGGALGSAAKLGTTISDMQKNVSELQKSLETLNEIKAALGG
jgi:hypothetical protein